MPRSRYSSVLGSSRASATGCAHATEGHASAPAPSAKLTQARRTPLGTGTEASQTELCSRIGVTLLARREQWGHDRLELRRTREQLVATRRIARAAGDQAGTGPEPRIACTP